MPLNNPALRLRDPQPTTVLRFCCFRYFIEVLRCKYGMVVPTSNPNMKLVKAQGSGVVETISQEEERERRKGERKQERKKYRRKQEMKKEERERRDALGSVSAPLSYFTWYNAIVVLPQVASYTRIFFFLPVRLNNAQLYVYITFSLPIHL